MEAEYKKDKYDEAKLELVSDMMAIYVDLLEGLGFFDFEPPRDDKILLNTPAARKLETIAIYAETGEGDPQTIFAFIQILLKHLHAPRISCLADEYYVPEEFWSRPTGHLIAKALSRYHGNDLLTIKEAAQLAGVRLATVSIALDTGKLTTYIDPSTRKRQGHRKVLRSEVLQRWGSDV